jgi:hypothetical protein
MTKATNAKNTPATNKGSNKEVIAPAAVVKAPAETIAAVVPPTKADKARAIFAECYGMEKVPARGDMIKRAVAEAGLTAKGAATYLQNYKSKNGLVAKKVAAPSA